jgi:hypothetical protein
MQENPLSEEFSGSHLRFSGGYLKNGTSVLAKCQEGL